MWLMTLNFSQFWPFHSTPFSLLERPGKGRKIQAKVSPLQIPSLSLHGKWRGRERGSFWAIKTNLSDLLLPATLKTPLRIVAKVNKSPGNRIDSPRSIAVQWVRTIGHGGEAISKAIDFFSGHHYIQLSSARKKKVSQQLRPFSNWVFAEWNGPSLLWWLPQIVFYPKLLP